MRPHASSVRIPLAASLLLLGGTECDGFIRIPPGVVVGVLAGAGFGVYRAMAFQRSIVPENVEVRPDLMRDGRPGVRVPIRF